MSDVEVDLDDVVTKKEFTTNPYTWEQTYSEGVNSVEIQYNFTIPAGEQRKLRVTATILGVP